MEPKSRRNYPGINIKDIKGMTVPFIFNNAISRTSVLAFNYNTNTQPEGVFIIPLSAGVIKVELFGDPDGTVYTISAAEVTAYTGKPLPYRIKAIIATDTTVTNLNIVW